MQGDLMPGESLKAHLWERIRSLSGYDWCDEEGGGWVESV